MSEEEDSFENQENGIIDTLMHEESLSKYSIALEAHVFDLELSKAVKIEMTDKSILINPTLGIEKTLLTVANAKRHFFWISTSSAFTGVIVLSPLPLQIEWMNSKFAEAVADIDSLLLSCYYCHSTFIGILNSGYFIPYKIVF